jgi:ABC-2 type transport system ATP-binding protein
MMNTIEAQNLSRQFGTVHAVENANFSVPEAEIFGFLGPNGAGKTTTIRILTGQLRPPGGGARVAGCDVVNERKALKERIGVVFEYQNLYERMTAMDNLIFIADLYGVPRRRVAEALDQVGLTDRAREPVKRYSNGMKQRLLIARALLPRPKVLFLDEPTRGLDPGMARQVRGIIAGLAKDGMTVFLTTHYMEEADRLCARVAILDRGRIVALDAPNRLKETHGGAQETLEDVFLRLTGSSLQEVGV